MWVWRLQPDPSSDEFVKDGLILPAASAAGSPSRWKRVQGWAAVTRGTALFFTHSTRLWRRLASQATLLTRGAPNRLPVAHLGNRRFSRDPQTRHLCSVGTGKQHTCISQNYTLTAPFCGVMGSVLDAPLPPDRRYTLGYTKATVSAVMVFTNRDPISRWSRRVRLRARPPVLPQADLFAVHHLLHLFAV
ncbi:uncharacterized protein EI97DRAFT_94031 [Westerdykella ornata]|uniref:Uncharacterized protein n=1 Tax=Westerdykella ornata TaxID=318751 RepID=A0A6A6JEU2_WESOR|nr:uncharacterized protein EI97DRAFT_94031 [Westerdykella ornata]KAF2274932.1 hypothetical protein EI97DRAFT_94031 [Westerdykella ornata]